ncbi:glycerol-3-phosphate responsive antiterminator [Bacillus daqingensis]|uniref:Glycerol uptake operon antiterminator regulatory protein n=1 Tax=Bacillus daqingensis TaxID=872396 RepID=A0ABV9NWZ5_9BACI
MNSYPTMNDVIDSQVIAAVKREKDMEAALKCKADTVFLLCGDLISAGNMISALNQADKKVFLHIDLLEGIDNSKHALRFAAKEWKITGIITTRLHVTKNAKKEGLLAIQRIFAIDQSAYQKGLDMGDYADALEVLPGVMPKVIDKMTKRVSTPIIAGGLIESKQEIREALKAGALAASVSNTSLWNTGL